MKKKRNRYRYVTMRLPYEDASKGIVARDVVVDSEHGDDETGDGSHNRPLRTKRGIKKLIERMAIAYEQRERDNFEAHHKADREAAEKEANDRYLAQEAERKAKEAERKAKAKELDDKIAQVEVELTSLEKTYLETVHLFELAQLELVLAGQLLTADAQRKHAEAKALATQLHHLRMALMARSAEHEMLVEQRGKKSSWESLLGGPLAWALIAGAGFWAYKLFAKGAEKK